MSPKSLIVSFLLAMLAVAGTAPARAASPLTADMMYVVLRPELPDDKNYLIYLAALLSNDDIPRELVESTLLWARRKPKHKYRYFKRALILRGEEQGIHLPVPNPETTGTIEGTVVYRYMLLLVKIEIPLANATVTIRGTELETKTNAQGKFSFDKVPFGKHWLHVEGRALLKTRSGAATVKLPTPPPSDDPATPFIVTR